MAEETRKGPEDAEQLVAPEVSHDERVMAAIAHGGILVGILTGGIGGIVVALFLWLTQKEKSAFVAFQSLQATVYQAVGLLLTTLAFGIWGVCWVLLLVPPLVTNPDAYANMPPPTLWFGLLLLCLPLGLWFVFILYGLWAALRTLGGYDFRYAFIGDWLARQR